MAQPLELKLTVQEANVLLRALASHSDREATEPLDRSTCRWLAERILPLVIDAAPRSVR